MSLVEVKVPEVGESVTEGVLLQWHRADGEIVAPEEELFELETDKITMQVPAPQGGRLSIEVEAGSEVEIGQVVGHIDPEAARDQGQEGAGGAKEVAPGQGREPAEQQREGQKGEAAEDAEKSAPPPLSPAVRRLVQEHQLDPEKIAASGKDGRLTKGDVLAHLERREQAEQPGDQVPSPEKRRPSPALQGDEPATSGEAAGAGPRKPAQRQTRQKMSSLRRRLAERLVAVGQEAAILTTFNEADMSAVIALRAQFKEEFSARHGVKLGFMSFFVKAAVEALRSVPALNAQIDGDELVQNHYYDIGVAVSTPSGLVVPVVRDAERLSFAEIERTLADLAERARKRRLELAELGGGCFTVSNGGIYGSMLSTPIINPPQSGILGMHAIKKRAVVVDDEIVIRPMMYLALSYDHRVVDGEQAVTFLRRIVDCIENPTRLMLET